MKKRIFAMLFAVMLLVTAISTALAAESASGNGEGYYYVYTENGKGLNVRDTPNGTVVGSLKYGTKIYVYNISGNWALITYHYNMPGYGEGDYACYVNKRFLTKTKPAARTSSTTVTTTATSSSGTLDDVNVEFRSAVKVATPYAVTVRPSRVTGWVNLRWAPSLEAEILATYKANDKLLVIQELNNWYQVEDQDTGNVGFISKNYVEK